MKTTLRFLLVIASSVLLSLSTAIFAGAVTSSATKSEFESKYEKSSLSHRGAQQAPAITNETEYAELVRKREAFNQASSVHSALSSSASSSSTSSRKLLKQSP
jgi:hypothetical protein